MYSTISTPQRPIPVSKLKGWRAELNNSQPFPSFGLKKQEIQRVFRCVYDGKNFLVTNQLDMHTLHHNGAFGTSTLTFRGPSYGRTAFMRKPYFRKGLRSDVPSEASNRHPTGSLSTFVTSNGGTKRLRVDEGGSVANISEESNRFSSKQTGQTGEDKDRPVRGSKYNFRQRTRLLEDEKLILIPEEVIFLSFGVGCLAIYDVQGQPVDYRQCWKNLVSINPNFPAQYAVYHYYRAKNWVPKVPSNDEASYMLYKEGPEFYHATYAVHIIGPSKPRPTWLELSAWQRMAKNLSKDVLLCEVTAPKTFKAEMSEPHSVFEMIINEMTFCKWPARENLDSKAK